MTNFDKLIARTSEKGGILNLRFNPEERGECWGIKYYPNPDDDGHYYAFHDDLNECAHKILDELSGFSKW